MSELEKARAGVFLSLLALMLTWLLLSNGNEPPSAPRASDPLLVCASTHGALCDVKEAAALATPTPIVVEEVVVTASRLPADLGELVVSATRLPEEPFAKVRLANAKGGSRDSKSKPTVAR